jgi:cysteine synthase
MQTQHKTYNQQVPMSDKNQLPTNQPTAYIYNYQNAIYNNPQTYVGQNFENPSNPTTYEPLSEDEIDMYKKSNLTWLILVRHTSNSIK